MIILAIDPGYERLGIAVMEKAPGMKKEKVLYSSCIRTKATLPHSERLAEIGKAVGDAIDKYRPEAMAIETLFFSTNKKTALSVAEARGAIILSASSRGVLVCEHSPAEVKIAVTGYGASDKEQVTSMVCRLVEMDDPGKKRLDDEYDAMAIGVACLAHQSRVRICK